MTLYTLMSLPRALLLSGTLQNTVDRSSINASEIVSPKAAATIIIQNQLIVLQTDTNDISALFADMYYEMIRIKVGNRPGRVEPRAVKRRPKNFPRLRKHRSKYKKTTRS